MITSRDNPRVRRWAKLVRDGRLRRRERRAIVEGPHLVAAAKPLVLLVSESGQEREEIRALVGRRQAVVLSDGVFRALVDAETPPGIAAEIAIPAHGGEIAAPAVFLEGVQDPGNVGTVLRSAAAFGLRSAVLDRACADPWSPKALRAGMGAHFVLGVFETDDLSRDIQGFRGRVLCAVPRLGIELAKADLSGPLGWLLGAEGHGVSPGLQAKAAERVMIPMAGAESINVAAAAAICFYAAFARQRG